MNRLLAMAAWMAAGPVAVNAQGFDQHKLQLHGFGVQSFVYSSANNYLGLHSSDGSLQWTEAALNVNEQLSEKLRVGAQVHLTRVGEFGGNVPSVDWALADYSAASWMGVRVGKVKIKWGLFNDTQDADPGYLWSLLPESVYGVDSRATNLSQYGAELYGRVPLGRRFGDLDYSAYWGYYAIATNDGYAAGFDQQGLTFVKPAIGKTPGFDLRWNTPVKGLTVSGSLMAYDARGSLTNGTYYQPLAYWPTCYAQYHRRNFFAAWQFVKLVQYQTVTQDGIDPATSVQDTRAWFAMADYRVTNKIQLGSYYTRYLLASGGDNSDSANYFHDVVISARYDVNGHIYAKAEGHLVDGNALGFYAPDNVNGLQPKTNLVVLKTGFTF